MRRPNIPQAMFFLSAAALLFMAGLLTGHYRTFPYGVIRAGLEATRQVLSERGTITATRPEQLTQLARYPGEGVTRIVEDKAMPGLTFVSSFYDGLNEMRLVRLGGSIEHRWTLRYFEVFPTQDHLRKDRVPQSEWNVATHGALALPDGSIVFNFSSLGTAKLDQCGAVQWTLPLETHHSLEPSQDGGFWVAGREWVEEESPFPLLKPVYAHDKILKVSADGELVREISVLGLLFKNGLEALLFSNGLPGIQVNSTNPLHLNDIEELDAEMASSFPMFAAGDLMLSLRNRNMVLVIDPDTELIKWYQIGPWISQHDPDFLATGRISVFSNNDDGSDGQLLGGSRIVEVDPVTRETRVRYGGTPDQMWYSEMMGKHQYLANGNVLITDAESGRIIEVDDAGEIVWEYINRYDDDYVAEIWGATRYPEDYFTVEQWTCEE